MINNAKVIINRRYAVDKGSLDLISGVVAELAAADKKEEEDYIAETFGDCTHLYHFNCVTNHHRNIRLPKDIRFLSVKKILIVIASRGGREAWQTEDYLGGIIYAKWTKEKNIVTYRKKPTSALLRVDIILAGEELLTFKDETFPEFERPTVQPEPVVEHPKPKPIPVPALEKTEITSPKEIFKLLDRQVFGQDEAKKSLSVILFQHLKRRQLRKNLKKTNALLIGPTGCGKTLLARTLSDIADIPFVRLDSTNLVQRGYRGGVHVDQLASLLLAAANGEKDRAKYGIIFIDEIDKIASHRDNSGDIATEGVQSDLLSLIDGGELFYEPDESYTRRKFNFRNVLFLFGGAFSRINDLEEIDQQELVKNGFMPEFANRLGSIINLQPLGQEVIKKLIRREVEEYNAYLPMTGEERNVYAELLHSIILSDKSHEKMGGRCVGPLVRKFFEERLFKIEPKEVISSGQKEEDG